MATSDSNEVQKNIFEETNLHEILKQLEIVTEQLNLTNSRGVLIGSRASQVHFRSFRGGELAMDVDWDL